MTELTNMQLTTGFKALSESVDELRTDLKKVMPEVIEQILKTKTELDTTLGELREQVAPVIQEVPKIKLEIEKARRDIDETNDLLKKHVNPIIDRFPELNDNIKQTNDKITYVQNLLSISDTRMDQLGREQVKAQDSINELKRSTELHVAQIQGQLATAMSSQGYSSTSSGSAGPRAEDHLATHKLLSNIEKIVGDESYKTLGDWYAEIRVNMDLIIPEAELVLEWAE